MKGLFWRVFAWYLGSTVALLVIGIGLLRVTDPEFNFNRSVTMSRLTVESQAQDAVKAWNRGGQAALRAAFGKAAHARYLFDAYGHELSGRPVPPLVTDLALQTRSGSALELEFLGSDTYAAVSLNSGPSRYVFVRVLPPEQPFRLIGRPMPLWGRLGLGLFTALIICMVFALYVTSPLQRMRAATREFASGNLQVRIGKAKPFNRGDEFADLASDFDNMASQIENLVLSQQRLLGDISHELRSPLARLQIALEIARRKAGPNAETPLNRIEQEAERMNTLIGQILRTAREQAVMPGGRKLFDLSNLVREVAADADYEASAKDRRVVMGATDLCLIHGDRDLLRSAIENVVRNAIRYTPEHSEVTIDLKKANATQALVSVRDKGPGVPADALQRLFEPFYRVNDARDRDSGGAGLGLAITRQVITAHGGGVRAANCKGGGLEVTIELPLKVPESLTRSGIKFRA
jgi:two-component system sensor histidine kinase CpxA